MKRIRQTILLISMASIGSAIAALSPIPATGWNHDMVINYPTPFNESVTGTMDGGFGQAENQTWLEAGTYTNNNGEEVVTGGLIAGSHASLTGNGTFAFQSFTGNNVIGLDNGANDTLTLNTPASYSSIALFGATGGGGQNATITLTFTDTSTTVFNIAGTGIATDWFNSNPDKAFEAGWRASNKSEEGYTRLFLQENSVIGINESLFNLASGDQSKLLESVNILNDGGSRMAVFALSGQVVPEPSTLALLGLASVGTLLIRRRCAR